MIALLPLLQVTAAPLPPQIAPLATPANSTAAALDIRCLVVDRNAREGMISFRQRGGQGYYQVDVGTEHKQLKRTPIEISLVADTMGKLNDMAFEGVWGVLPVGYSRGNIEPKNRLRRVFIERTRIAATADSVEFRFFSVDLAIAQPKAGFAGHLEHDRAFSRRQPDEVMLGRCSVAETPQQPLPPRLMPKGKAR